MIAVIGAGHWGKNLVRNFFQLGVLTAVVEQEEALRKSLREQYPPVRVFDSIDELRQDGSISAIAIATPAATHGAIVDWGLESGFHVFVEKPLCLDVPQAETLGRSARQRERVLMVGHLLQYHSGFHALQSAITQGVIGTLRYIYSNRASLGKIRREENALWSFAPHDISMILALTGTMPTRVVANGGNYLASEIADITLSHMQFPDGVQAHVFVSWLHPYKEQRLVVIGSKGMIVFNDVAVGPEKLLLYPHTAEWNGGVPLVTKAEAEPIPFEPGEPLRRECEAFISAISGGPAPPTDAEEGIRVLKVLDASQRSLTSGEPVTL